MPTYKIISGVKSLYTPGDAYQRLFYYTPPGSEYYQKQIAQLALSGIPFTIATQAPNTPQPGDVNYPSEFPEGCPIADIYAKLLKPVLGDDGQVVFGDDGQMIVSS